MSFKSWFAGLHQDNEYEDEQDYESEGSYDTSSSAVTEEEAAAPSRFTSQRSEKVINLHSGSSMRGSSVKVVQPIKYDDVMKEPVRFLRDNMSVILNLEKVASVDSRKRIVDFMAGVVAAIDGRIVRVAECTYIVVPKTVDLSGDMMENEEQF